jgi:hypothetical protein
LERFTILLGLSQQIWFGMVLKVELFAFWREIGNKKPEWPTVRAGISCGFDLLWDGIG